MLACSSPPKKTELTAIEADSPVENLSANKVTQIQTSTGTIKISPTVVSSDDSVATSEHSVLPENDYYDPLEPLNRVVFGFNHYSYKYLLIPTAKAYNAIVPAPAQRSINNAFDNIREPLNFLNNIATGEFSEASTNLGRFLINSTLGLFGLFDPAVHWFDLQQHPQTMAQTLSQYQVGSGAYLVLPFLGQSDIRSASSMLTEGVIHPTNYILESPQNSQVRIFGGFTSFTSRAEMYLTLYQQSEDPYQYFRNLHIQGQNRNEQAHAIKEIQQDGKAKQVQDDGATHEQ
jgi:phospholipid-binding lipoprotein MlaA